MFALFKARSCVSTRVKITAAAAFLAVCAGPLFAAATSPQPPVQLLPNNELYVGTCYQPVDRTRDQIRSDIGLMKAAGFRMVRIGDLSWDAVEPKDGVFDFSLFDFVMDEMNKAGIKVIFDISGLPAPTWLHHSHPEVDLVDSHGARLHAAERYMDDISAPAYKSAVQVMATATIRHYAHHPALAAFGYDNEIGNGFLSYSEGDRQRFISWLQQRYGTIAALNTAWSTQRWSRRIDSWDEVELPYNDGPGPPERFLDLRRFWSDQTIQTLMDLETIRRQYAPNIPTASNLWDTADRKGFDYLNSYKGYVSYGAEGFYPSAPLDSVVGALMNRGDLATPIWFDEFVTGGAGIYGGPKGKIRMWAYMGLLNYGQTYLAWTFNTHLGGEEQALFGLLDHDGTPSWKYKEFSRIAREFHQLQTLGFPRQGAPAVAIAYSFDSNIAFHYPTGGNASTAHYLSIPYRDQVDGAYAPLFRDNIDAAFINLASAPLSSYKLVIVPGDYIMDARSSAALREYVTNGGTVVMTAFSAKADQNSRWFDTPLPGSLSDVFGLRTSQFYELPNPLTYELGDKRYESGRRFYEVLEPHSARILARFTDTPEGSPSITENAFGKGRAIYVAMPAEEQSLGPILRVLYGRLGIERGPETPDGVYARVVEGRTLYVNTTDHPAAVSIHGKKTGVLSAKSYDGVLTLEPYDAELVQ